MDIPGSLAGDPQRPELAVAAAADVAAVGDALADVVERLAGQPLAGQDVGDARRVGGERLGRDPARGLVEGRRPPAGRGRPRAASSPARPRAAAAPAGSCGRRPARSPASPTASAQRRDQALAARRRPARRGRRSRRRRSRSGARGRSRSLLEGGFRQPVAAGAGPADVDREPQRVPAGDAGAPDQLLVEDGEPGDRPDLLPRPRRSRRGSRPSSSPPCTEARRRAASSEPESSALGLVDSTRLTQRSTTAASSRSPPPRWSIAAWVRLPTILWVEEVTRSAPQLSASGGRSGWKWRWAPQASSTTSGRPRSCATSARPATSAQAPK